MKTPNTPANSFLDFQKTKSAETVVARSEGVNVWHVINLMPGCLAGLLCIALVYFSFTYLIFCDENRFGGFAAGLGISLFVAAFGWISSRNTIQAVWGSVTLTIINGRTLRIVHTTPANLLGGDFPTEVNPLHISLSHVKEIRTAHWGTFSDLLVFVKQSHLLPKKEIRVLGCRCQSDLKWLQGWIESHRIKGLETSPTTN